MKHHSFLSAFVLGISIVLTNFSAKAQLLDFFQIPQAQSPVSSAEMLNIETPFRCQVNEFKDQNVISTIALKKNDFKLTQINVKDALPRYEVNGFSFENMPLDEALQQLVDEAKIEVYTEDERYLELNAQDIYGELASVVDELAKAGDVFYSYDDRLKRLHLSRYARFEITLPKNRLVMLAVLDALRGAHIENVLPDWNRGVIQTTLTRIEEKKAADLLKQIVSNGQIVMADTQVYALSSLGGANWGSIIQQFGADRIYTSHNGLMGKILSMGHQHKTSDLLSSVSTHYQVTPISQGVSVVPNGWKMRFDIGRCAVNSYASIPLSLLLFPHINTNDIVDVQITLDSKSGELSTFRVAAAIDNELAIIGIPDTVSGTASELLVTLKLKLIRLVGEN